MALVGANGKIQPCTVIAQIANQVVFHFRSCFVSRIIHAMAILQCDISELQRWHVQVIKYLNIRIIA